MLVMIEARSTLKRPTAKQLAAFHPGMINADDSVGLYLEKGWSLAICCKECERLTEWTPHELQKRFADRPHIRIRGIAERLTCGGEDGCGSRDIAVFPHAFDGVWRRAAADPQASR